MKAQFFIISSVIMIYVIVLTFQYLTGFSDIRVTQIEEQQEFSYIQNIKDNFIQIFNASNQSSEGDLNKIMKDFTFTDNFLKQEMLKKGINFHSNFIIFSNGFETGDLIEWHLQDENNGDVYVISSSPFNGNYHAFFETYGDPTWFDSASVGLYYKLSEIYIGGYFRVIDGLPLQDQWDRFSFIYLRSNISNEALALAGVRHNSTTDTDQWHLMVRDGDEWTTAIIDPDSDVKADRWYYVELYWKKDSVNGTAKMWVNGELVNEKNNIDTSYYGDTDLLRVGINDAFYVQNGVKVEGDCMTFSNNYIEPNCFPDAEPYFFFTLKTEELYSKMGFEYEEELKDPSLPVNVLWLKFNEGIGTTVFDSSTYNNDGTFYGESFNDGRLGDENCDPGSGYCPNRINVNNGYFSSNALDFDGSNDFVNVSDDPSLDVQNITITAWIYPTGFGEGSGMGRIVNKWGGAYMFYLYNLSSSPYERLTFYYVHSDGTKQAFSNYYSISLNSWQHVAVTYDGVSVRFYVNGVYRGGETTNHGPISSSSSNLYIGNGWISGSDRTFDGIIDEVRIWNRRLNITEIQAEMQSSLPVIRPVASWSFEEESSARYVNDTHIWVKGNLSSGLSFDGINDYVEIINDPSLNPTSSITVSLWMNINTTGNYINLINKNQYKQFYLRAGIQEGDMYWYVNFTDATSKSIDRNIGWKNNTWHYLTATLDTAKQEIKLYLDGAEKFSDTFGSDKTIVSTSNPLLISRSDQRQIKGIIDNVRIWNKALSQTEIQNIMDEG